MTNSTKTNSNRFIVIISALIIVIIALVAVVFIVLSSNKSNNNITPPTSNHLTSGKGTIITPDNADKVLNETKIANGDASYRTIMNVEWNFANGSAVSTDAYVENSTSNSRTVYFVVTLDGTNEVVYTSPYIPVGSALKDIKLDSNLKKGDYKAVVTYYLVDDNYKEITSVAVYVTLHVLN